MHVFTQFGTYIDSYLYVYCDKVNLLFLVGRMAKTWFKSPLKTQKRKKGESFLVAKEIEVNL